jgi:hypothetical protein
MISELDLLREKNPKKLLELIIQFETDKTHKGVIYSKNSCTPKTTLNGQNWLDHLSHLSEFISILDLGAGDTLAQYLNPYEENITDQELLKFYEEFLFSGNVHLTTHSLNGPNVNLPEHITHLQGHYFTVLDNLLKMGQKFDVIISHLGLYHSRTAPLLIKKIDNLLTPRGKAFIDCIQYRGSSPFYIANNVHEIPENFVDESGLPLSIFGGEMIEWQQLGSHLCAAWQKGSYSEPEPELVSVVSFWNAIGMGSLATYAPKEA